MVITRNIQGPARITVTATALQPRLGIPAIAVEAPALTSFFKEAPESFVQTTAPRTVAVQVAGGIQRQGVSDLRFKGVGEIYEDQTITSLARILLPSGGPIQQSDVSSDILLEVYNLTSDDPDIAVAATTSLTAVSSIFNAYQVDTYWDADTVGYNFKHSYTPEAGLLEGGNTYRFEYKITTSSDGLLFVVTEVAVRSVYSV